MPAPKEIEMSVAYCRKCKTYVEDEEIKSGGEQHNRCGGKIDWQTALFVNAQFGLVQSKLTAANDTIKALRDDRQSLLNANAVMSYEISALRVGFCRLKEIANNSFPPDPDSRKSCQVMLKAIEKLSNSAVSEVETMMRIPEQALKDGECPERMNNE